MYNNNKIIIIIIIITIKLYFCEALTGNYRIVYKAAGRQS